MITEWLNVNGDAVAGFFIVLAVFSFGGAAGFGYGLFLDVTNKYRWAKYYGSAEWFSSMHCRDCSCAERVIHLDFAEVDSGISGGYLGSEDDAA